MLNPFISLNHRCFVFAIFISCLLLGSSTFAQNVQHNDKAIDPGMRGTVRVNPVTRAVGFQVSLGNYPGRAGLGVPVTLNYSSKLWEMKYQGFNPGPPPPHGGMQPFTIITAEYSKNSMRGWTSSVRMPTIDSSASTHMYNFNGAAVDQGFCSGPCYVVDRKTVWMPDGSAHELRASDQPRATTDPAPDNFYAVDGSRLRYQVSTGTLFLPDGSRYLLGAGQYIDRNGNKLTFNGSGVVDTLGHQINNPLPSIPVAGIQNVSVPGFNGVPLDYTLEWRNLADALTTPEPLRYTGSSGCPPSTGGSFSPSLFFSDTGVLTCIGNASVQFNPVVLYQIKMPNQQAYTFTYNIYGEIDKIQMPTGGYERFQYGQVPAVTQMSAVYAQTNRGVSSRIISVSGLAIDEVEWQYTSTGPGNVTIISPAPVNTRSELFFWTDSNSNWGYSPNGARAGCIYEERVYSSSGVMLRRKLTDWAMTGSNATALFPGAQASNRNARVVREVEFILDTGGQALARSTVYGYDPPTYEFTVGLEQTSVQEFDYVSVAQSTAQTVAIGSLATISNGTSIRRSAIGYLTTDQNYRDRNMLGLPTSKLIYDGNNNLVRQETFFYDETAYAPMSSGSAPYTAWVDPATTFRGNLTTSKRWLNTSGTLLETHTQHDQFGSIRKAWDARQKISQINYSSVHAFAYPTEAISPDPDGSGPLTAHTTYTEYDSATGRVTAMVDANGQRSEMSYAEPLNRLKQIVQAATDTSAKSQTTYTYDDVARTLTVTSDQNAYNDNLLKTMTFFDGMGRMVQSRSYETSNDYIAVRTEYDELGRVLRTSNPYRNAETAVWTTKGYDPLSRVVSITTPDNAVVTTAYSGNRMLVTDQAGKQRISKTDPLGRLTDLWEVTAADAETVSISFPSHPEVTAGYLTSYQYDTMDNVTKVTQGVQQRFFMFDSLGRLIRVRIPEQLTNLALNLSDPLTLNGSWTTAYQYDDNGNVTQRTDARNVVTTFVYDDLNRVTSENYSDTTLNPDVTRAYDGATNGKGKFWSSKSFGTGADVEHFVVDSYDALGRPLVQRQLFKTSGTAYQTSRIYNRAGSVTSQTYPSGRTALYAYDQMGRTTSFAGNLGDNTTRTYAGNITYSPFGGLSKEQFGTNTALYHKSFYNVRGQFFDTRLSSVNDTWDWNRGRLALYYSSNHLWGQSGTDNNGNVLFAESWIPPENATLDQASSLTEDSYVYDALNRLKSVTEQRTTVAGGWGTWTPQFHQAYEYDRYGNRTIKDAPTTWGTGINKKQFTVDTNTNRLGVPGGQTGSMTYDAAGNLTFDTYTEPGMGLRTYDAENRMIGAQDSSGIWAYYTYSADGHRTRRKINGQETWQVYSFEGELLAEYAAEGAVTNPTKEYGYRNGKLLVTAEPGSGGGLTAQNVSWTNGVGVSISGNNVTRTLAGDAWNTGAVSSQTIPSGDGYVEITASETNKKRTFGLTTSTSVTGMQHVNYAMHMSETGQITIHEGVSVYGVFGTYTTGDVLRVAIEGGVVKYRKNGTLLRTSTLAPTYPLRAGASLFTNGSTVNNAVITAGPQNVSWTNGVGVSISGNNVTRTLAGDAWNAGAVSNETIASGDGYVEITASETNKKRTFGLTTSTSVTGMQHVNYAMHMSETGQITIHEGVSVYGVFGTYMTGDVLRVAIEGGVVKYRKNGTLLRTSTLAPTYPLRAGASLFTNGSTVNNAILSLGSGGGSSAQVLWLVKDHLDTTRIVVDQTGTLANIKRHDYLPFGEELLSGTGGRGPAEGFGGNDGVRQKFTGKERDNETKLDFFEARYFSSTQGRFTRPDPALASAQLANPQSLNRYSYCLNNPLAYVDPSGLWNWSAALGGSLTDDQLRARQREIANDDSRSPEQKAQEIAEIDAILTARQQFRDALDLAKTNVSQGDLNAGERAAAMYTLNLYGTENDGNGVIVAISSSSAGAAFTRQENGKIIVAITPRQMGNANTLWTTVFHEGVHVFQARVYTGLGINISAAGAEEMAYYGVAMVVGGKDKADALQDPNSSPTSLSYNGIVMYQEGFTSADMLNGVRSLLRREGLLDANNNETPRGATPAFPNRRRGGWQ